MSEHTPGPWTVYKGEILHGDEVLAEVSVDVQTPDKVARANARLMASAPDLLAELRAASSDIHYAIESLLSAPAHAGRDNAIDALATRRDRIHATIVKATGRGP